MTVIFTYSKNGILKVIDDEATQNTHDELLLNGWIHTATIDPCVYLQYLCNESKTIETDIKSLLTK